MQLSIDKQLAWNPPKVRINAAIWQTSPVFTGYATLFGNALIYRPNEAIELYDATREDINRELLADYSLKTERYNYFINATLSGNPYVLSLKNLLVLV